jgi:signal transduction histidine kinase
MDNLINGLLMLSRLGRQELNREWIFPVLMIREVVAELLKQVPEQRISVSIGDLPPCSADPVMLRQVYVNLLSNAFKFSRYTSEPRIEIGGITNDTDTIYYVRDNGVGFDLKYAEQIFKPFYRLHKTDEYEGSGIGLATVDRIIRRHGGRIWVESEVGKGSTFYFTLPAR